MKKTFLMITLVVLACSRLIALNIKGLNPLALAEKNFKIEYPEAVYVSWKQIDKTGIYEVRFIYNNQSVAAYYNDNGIKIAQVKLLRQDSIPLKVQNKINSLYKAEEIKGIQELVMFKKTCYFFDIEKKGQRKIIGIHSNGHFNRLVSYSK